MTIWSGEIKELDKVFSTLKGHLPEIMKEMEQLIRTDDPNVVMLYSRRCLELIVTDLCETELNRPRKTEPLKGIIDKLNSEEKVPSYIITSMLSLNSMANYGAHPKDFDPEQVRPVLNNLTIIIKWYLKYKDFRIVSNTDSEKAKEPVSKEVVPPPSRPRKKRSVIFPVLTGIIIVAAIIIALKFFAAKKQVYDPELLRSGNYLIDSRDNRIYRTVTIGDQTWTAENLKAEKFNDGTTIPLIKGEKEWENAHAPGFCWYVNNKRIYGEAYGALYNWFTVNTGKLCPVGWHVPSRAEWTTLIRFTGDTIDWFARGDTVPAPEHAAQKLKAPGNIYWFSNDSISGEDLYRFTALPGGVRTIYGLFYGLGEKGAWWTSTEDFDKGNGRDMEMFHNQNDIVDIQQYKQFGMSVRCIKDKN